MPSLTIRRLLEQVNSGQVRIPAFQRGFVWDMDRVAHLIDSLYKQYPFGSLLLWRTKNQLVHDRNLGPYELPDREPDYPIDYVLDGQQRITSIFGVFEPELPKTLDVGWLDVYFDFRADANVQESQFLPLRPDEVDLTRHFPVSTVFNTAAYRAATEVAPKEAIPAIDNMYEVFKEVQIPVQQLETEDRTMVAIVFERINRLGVELDTLQLLTAWTWSEDFDLQDRFAQLKESLAEYGFSEVGDDTNLVLRCAAAVLRQQPSAESLILLNGSEVREQFDNVENGIRGAIDFLRTELHVETLRNLPYPALLVPLAVFFAEPNGKQVKWGADKTIRLRRWFWRACFSGRYSGQTLRAARADIQEMVKLKNGEVSDLGEFTHDIDEAFFTGNRFRISSAGTKTFVLLLAQHAPRTFITGGLVELGPVLQAYNRSEFHHLYPKAYLRSVGVSEELEDALANFCFLSRSDNNQISGQAPSSYRALMPTDVTRILTSAVVPDSLFADNFESFVADRANLLLASARDLMA